MDLKPWASSAAKARQGPSRFQPPHNICIHMYGALVILSMERVMTMYPGICGNVFFWFPTRKTWAACTTSKTWPAHSGQRRQDSSGHLVPWQAAPWSHQNPHPDTSKTWRESLGDTRRAPEKDAALACTSTEPRRAPSPSTQRQGKNAWSETRAAHARTPGRKGRSSRQPSHLPWPSPEHSFGCSPTDLLRKQHRAQGPSLGHLWPSASEGCGQLPGAWKGTGCRGGSPPPSPDTTSGCPPTSPPPEPCAQHLGNSC
jgi:hypothetical protein